MLLLCGERNLLDKVALLPPPVRTRSTSPCVEPRPVDSVAPGLFPANPSSVCDRTLLRKWCGGICTAKIAGSMESNLAQASSWCQKWQNISQDSLCPQALLNAEAQLFAELAGLPSRWTIPQVGAVDPEHFQALFPRLEEESSE